MVSLGSDMHAREGQRFSVWSTRFPGNGGRKASGPLAPLYKGEIVLMEVHDTVSQAEIIHLGEPGWNMEQGDHLILLPEEQGSHVQGRTGEARLDPVTGLLRHGDFLARWAEERDRTDRFALVMVRLALRNKEQIFSDAGYGFSGEEETGGDAAESVSAEADGLLRDMTDETAALYPGRCMAEAVRLCREDMRGKNDGQSLLGGRYGLNSLIFFHPDADFASLPAIYEQLAGEIEKRLGLDVAVGIALHPFLDFRKADALENCRKALEYGMLLPKPHVGVLDSLALNISADKHFSQGDIFGAIKEYQLALLADENNGMAWNSLGICLAGLNRHSEAERHFSRALECNGNDTMALYNLGYMHQSQGQEEQARDRYLECLRHEGDHLFAIVRLGQLAENAGKNKIARQYYEKAAILPGGESLTYRHFARLCIGENKLDEARELLHEALLYDPQDALSMSLLAGLYLDAGEDPEMAATLARQSVSLLPGLKSGWMLLARALEGMGRSKEAREARLKAGEV
jgi:tetratricopeptide (TPR) repeat protein